MASIRSDLSTSRRVYVQTEYGEPAVERLKKFGAKWDKEKRAWWVGRARLPELEELLVEIDRQTEAAPPGQKLAQADPGTVRVLERVRYKGRSWYLTARSRDGTRARLVSLPDAEGRYLEFWADAAAVYTLRTYQPREYRGRKEYTTLASLAAFVRDQANPETRRGPCTECGSWGDSGTPCSNCGGEGHHV